jgi:hypothetical protein
MDYRANINAANNSGTTPLLYALQTNNTKLAQYLLSNGADVNKANNNAESPLFWAAYMGNDALVNDLLTLDADYKKVTNKNLTPKQAAERRNHPQTAKLIQSFIDYKNIPRDEKGRPIIPKAGAQKTAKPAAPAKPAQQQPSAPASAQPAAMPSMPAMPGMTFDPAAFGLPPEAAAAMQQAQSAQQQAAPPQAPQQRPGQGAAQQGTRVNELRTSTL